MDKRILVLLSIIIFLLSAQFVLAQIEFPNPISKYETLQDLINAVANFIFWVSLAITPLMVLVGAFYIMTAAGNPKNVQLGQKIILYAAIGLVLILFARGIVALVRYVMGVSEEETTGEENGECEHACTVGERRCEDETHYRICREEEPCPEWSEPQSCPSDWVCLDGECVNIGNIPE